MTDRAASLAKYASVFRAAFADDLGAVDAPAIAATFLALDERGYRPREEVYAGIVERLPWGRVPDVAAIRDHWRTWCPRSAVARDGLHETLASIEQAGIRLGVVTNGSESSQSMKIETLGIGRYFSTVVIGEVVRLEKPDRRIFHCALERIGCRAGSTLFIGDHPANDVLGSARAGLHPVWFEGAHPWPSHHPIPQRRIRALPEVLRHLPAADCKRW